MHSHRNNNTRRQRASTGATLPGRLLLLACCAWLLASPGAPAQRLLIRSDVVAAGPRVLLGELLMETRGIPGEWLDREVVEAPRNNDPTVLPITSIAYALQQYEDMRAASIHGGLRVTITRAQRLILPEELTRAVDEHIAGEQDEQTPYKVEYASVRNNIWVPKGETTFRVAPSRMASNHRSFDNYVVEVLVDDTPVCTVPVRARLYTLEEVWVAARPLDNGQLLREEDLRLELLPVEQKGERRVPGTEPIAGQELSRAVRQGMPVLRNYLRTPLCARKGDYVTVTAQRGSLQISLRGKALSTGRLGDHILVENPRSRRRMLVQLTGVQQGRVASM